MLRTEVALISGLVALDQAVKQLSPNPYLNTAGPFSLEWPGSIMIAYATITVLALVWILATARDAHARAQWYMCAIAAGGLSNLIDRIMHRGVRDVIELGPLLTNLADIYILVGIFGFIYYQLVRSKPVRT